VRRILIVAAAMAVAAFATAAALAAPPSNTQPPSITGTPRVGETLTAQNGTWTNSPTSFTYQWQRCTAAGPPCAGIAGATQRTYQLVAADAGSTIRVRVIAANADGASQPVFSPRTAVVTAAAGAPTNTARPTITGEARVGQELTAENGTWTGNPTSFAYQWQRCDIDAIICLAVGGATGKTYGVREVDIGFRLRVEVTARNAMGSNAAFSAPTDIVEPRTPITNATPTIRYISIRYTGARVYARFRICDDSLRNLTVLATDSRPRRTAQTRRFTTRVAPQPCGVYTRNWVPAARFRGPGHRITLRARDTSGRTSAPATRITNR
jgi:hypothetical protein